MADSVVIPPLLPYHDLDGLPLEDGYIYIGDESLNPVVNQMAVWWDAEHTISTAQPIRTIHGYPVRNGAPSQFYPDTDTYSISIYDKNQDLVISSFSTSTADSNLRSDLANDNNIALGAALVGYRAETVASALDKTRHNFILNGRMDMARTTAAQALGVTPTTTKSPLDGWYASQNTTAESTVRQIATSLTGIPFELNLQRNAGSTTTGSILAFYGVSTLDAYALAGKAFLLSFRVVGGANFSGANVNVSVYSGTGIDEDIGNMSLWTGAATPVATTKPVTTSYAIHTVTGTFATNATQIGLRFYYTPTGTAGAADQLAITDVLLIQVDQPAVIQEPNTGLIHILRPIAPTSGRLSNLITTGEGEPIPGSDPFAWCHFIPYNGNLILINGKYEVIPSGVIASSGGAKARYSNCYVNKVPGQTLANNTFYYIYAFMISGVMAIQFSTTGYTDGAGPNGVAVKTDDSTSTLIGICRIHYVGGVPTTYGSARGQTIASWFNRFPNYNLVTSVVGTAIVATSPAQLPDGSTLANGQPENNFIEWIQWGNQTPTPRFAATFGNAIVDKANYLGMGFNSKTVVHAFTFMGRSTTGTGADGNIGGHAGNIDGDSYNYVQMIGYTEAGGGSSATFSGLMMLDNICV